MAWREAVGKAVAVLQPSGGDPTILFLRHKTDEGSCRYFMQVHTEDVRFQDQRLLRDKRVFNFY